MERIGCIIVAGGDFSESEAEQVGSLMTGEPVLPYWRMDSVERKPFLIAADRGLENLLEYGVAPDLCIGDFDSVSDETAADIEQWKRSGEIEVIRLNPVKDDTDTEAALRVALERTDGDIAIFGGNGSRIDHLLANIHILRIALRCGRGAFLADGCNRVRLVDKPFVLKRDEQYGKYVSLFPFGGEVRGVTLEGFKYPLENAVLAAGSSLGTSNEIVGDVGEIAFVSGELVVVESRDGVD